jgi:hypothetical protein
MVKRGRWLLLGVGVALAAVAVYLVLAWMWQGVTVANVQRIVPGMTQAEVEGILGPPNDLPGLQRWREAFWDADAYSIAGRQYVSIWVHYDAESKVDGVQVTIQPRGP